jgi:hypothetical protein
VNEERGLIWDPGTRDSVGSALFWASDGAASGTALGARVKRVFRSDLLASGAD